MKPNYFKVVAVSSLSDECGNPLITEKVCESATLAGDIAAKMCNPVNTDVYTLRSVHIFPIFKPF